MSWDVGWLDDQPNRIRPYYAVVRESRSQTGGRTGRWYWTVRRYEDQSTAFRGAGGGFASRAEALADMERVLRTVGRLHVDVRDQ